MTSLIKIIIIIIIIIRHFLRMLFLENKTEISFKKYRTTFVMSKEVSLPIMSSILQKLKIKQKSMCHSLFMNFIRTTRRR